MGMFDGIGQIFGDIGSAVVDTIPDLAAVAAAPETGGLSLMDLAPSVIGGIGSYIGADQTNKASAAQADKQMAFQERMSNTAHQREVQDLIAAGLNPILSAKLGGASSPGGAMAPVQNALGQATSTASQNYQLEQQRRLISAQEMQSIANASQAENAAKREANQAELYRVEAIKELNNLDPKTTTPLVTAQINHMNAQQRQAHAQAGLYEEQYPEAKASGDIFRKYPQVKGIQLGGQIARDYSSAFGISGLLDKLVPNRHIWMRER